MNIEFAITMIGPIVMLVNIATMFLCFRPKRGIPFTLAVFVAAWAAIHFLYNPLVMHTPFAPYGGVILAPAMVLLFRGQTFQKVFAFFMGGQISSMQVSIADALVGSVTSTRSPSGQMAFFVLSMLLLGVYMALVLRYGKKFFERVFVDGRRGVWAIYAFGSAFSFLMAAVLQWTDVGAPLYLAMMLFILWSFGVLCHTIINTHEKAMRARHAATLQLQMDALDEQIDAEGKHHKDMETLRHGMRHEMAAIMELYRSGRAAEAETVYTDWQNTLQKAMPTILCREPILNAVFTRFRHRAEEKGIQLYVTSNIPETLPVDTIKLSVMVANALENALNATDEIPMEDKRIIRIQLIQDDGRIGLEVTNPCAAPVEFDKNGLPITREVGHGIGIRSIAAFAKNNDYLLAFSNADGIFTMRLIMEPDYLEAS